MLILNKITKTNISTKSPKVATDKLIIRIGFLAFDKTSGKFINSRKSLTESDKYLHGQGVRQGSGKLKEEALKQVENK